MVDFLYGESSTVISIFLFVLLILSYEVAYRGGRRIGARSRTQETPFAVQAVQGALLGLVGLLLGFSFAMSASRFEARKAEVVAEANAIGTAYLRSRLLPSPEREEAAEILRDYIDGQIEAYAKASTALDIRAAVDQSTAHHEALWAVAERAVANQRHDPVLALFISSVNDVIDEHARRIAAQQNRVPEPILFLLLLLCVGGVSFIGYGAGLTNARHWPAAITLALILTLVVGIILDLDRPRRGLIRVDQENLHELRDTISKTGVNPGVPDPAR